MYEESLHYGNAFRAKRPIHAPSRDGGANRDDGAVDGGDRSAGVDVHWACHESVRCLLRDVGPIDPLRDRGTSEREIAASFAGAGARRVHALDRTYGLAVRAENGVGFGVGPEPQ
jgi:hypothetical protein